MSNPTGYQNSFAANDLPSTVAVEIGKCFPYSAAKAFEKPVSAVDSNGVMVGFEATSVARLLQWDQERQKQYAGQVAPLLGMGLGDTSTADSLNALIASIAEQIDAMLATIPTKKAA